MNTRCSIIILLSGILLLGSCKKYLDVQPETSYTETQIYNNEAALQQAFNGLYLDLSQQSLYGAYMSSTIVELLAQRYKAVTDLQGRRNLSVFNYYDYQNTAAQLLLDTVWRKSYATILATNVFLSRIDNSISGNVISEPNGKLLKGEAIAIRALMHFDLLRLFGPVYATGSEETAIPYYTIADGKMQPLLTARQVMQKVIDDLTQASTLLANDPIISNGVVYTKDFYAGARNQRMNYYAVKALLARAYMWQGNTAQAHATAQALLNEGEKWFPWVTTEAATTATNPDRIFSTEIMFGLNNPELYLQYDLYFNPAQYIGAVMAPIDTRLNEVYEGLQQDYRYIRTWTFTGNQPYFLKYAPLSGTYNWKFIQPMLRKSELYLILAETEPDPATALGYLNTERRNRGLANLPSITSMAAELRKEYQKEFFGEGQLFYYYKRTNATSVPSADMPYVWATVDPQYKVPLPLSETSTR